jgi:hypothetical protein
MADTTRKLSIPSANLPPVNQDFDSYFLRYRIVSEDRNLFSEWSPIYQVSSNKDYAASGDGSIVYSPETKQLTASWPLESNISDYDVWYKWSSFTPAVLPTNTREISAASLNTITGKILYTTNTYGGYGPSHTYNVGDIVTIYACGNNTFNLRDYIIEEVPNRTSFVITNKSYIGIPPTSFTTPGLVYKEAWNYVGRVSGNSVDFYQKFPSDVRFSIRVYIPHYPISHNNDYLTFAYLDKTT